MCWKLILNCCSRCHLESTLERRSSGVAGKNKGFLWALRGPQRSMLQRKLHVPRPWDHRAVALTHGRWSEKPRDGVWEKTSPWSSKGGSEAEDEVSWGRQAMLAVLSLLLTMRSYWRLGGGWIGQADCSLQEPEEMVAFWIGGRELGIEVVDALRGVTWPGGWLTLGEVGETDKSVQILRPLVVGGWNSMQPRKEAVVGSLISTEWDQGLWGSELRGPYTQGHTCVEELPQ